MSTDAAITHYSASVTDEALCGAEWAPDWDVTAVKSAVTCPDCRADLAELERPAIACSSMHEHDDVACAAPSSAEMTLEAVSADLIDLYARILGVFEDEDASAEYALSKVGDRIERLLQLLGAAGVPVSPAFEPSATCPVCGARLTFDRWGEHGEAWVAEQVRAHVADCEADALSWVLYRPENGLAGDVLVAAGAEGPAPGNSDPIELARVQLAEHAAGREAWVVKVFGPDDKLRAHAEWEQGQAVGYAAGKAV